MTTLDTLGTATPDPHEVADAALAMADFDAKGGDHARALDWLAVAEQHRGLTVEYLDKRDDWEASTASACERPDHRGARPIRGSAGRRVSRLIRTLPRTTIGQVSGALARLPT